ncbi:MAG TPA: GDSL-type esterase/lipase family protein, partial [Myxococcota bacterium]|nr:GDSL-type esterase/lipase family protein [Myxococcota bacterium]
PRRLEFIGAAAEAGYGATESGARDGCEFSVDTENANLAYPRRVADLLGADYANISYSNKGVYRNLFPQRDSTTLPQLYDRIEPHDGAPWDFTAWQPDAVIIGLGGTDFDALGGSGSKAYRLPPPDEAAFVRAYADFLRLVRAKNPKAAVLCLINPLEDDTHQARSLLKKYLQAALAAVGDPSMLLLELPPYEGDTYGCDNQPDAALHAAMAEQVAAALRDALGW